MTVKPERYQVEVKEDLLHLMPGDVSRILDVGCGDGFITNDLPGGLFVVGLDIKRKVLPEIEKERIQGSVFNIPFKDGSFDLVMANDLLEHLELTSHPQAIQELLRVTSKYVIITVPVFEDLNLGIAKCAKCGRYFHVNHHLASFTPGRLRRLIHGPEFHCCRQILTGDRWSPHSPWRVLVKNSSPSILSRAPTPPAPTAVQPRRLRPCPPLSRLYGWSLRTVWGEHSPHRLPRRTECISLFTNRGSPPEDHTSGFVDEGGHPVTLPVMEQSRYKIDFSKEALFRARDLPRYSSLPYYVCKDVGERGAILSRGERICMGFFYCPQENEDLKLRLTGSVPRSSRLTLSRYEDHYGYTLVREVDVSGDFSIEIPVNGYTSSEFGLLFEGRTDGDALTLASGELMTSVGERITIYENPEGTARYWRAFEGNIIDVSLPLYGDFITQESLEPNLRPDENSEVPAIIDIDYLPLSPVLQKLAECLSRLRTDYQDLSGRHESLKAQNVVLLHENDLLKLNSEQLKSQNDALSRQYAALKTNFENLQSEVDQLRDKIEICLRVRLRKWFFRLGKGTFEYDPSLKERILQLSEPSGIFKKPENCRETSGKQFLMICHDQNIDRRIIQEARLLQARGWGGTIIALSNDNQDAHDYIDGIDVHRIGLSRVVADCPTYWRYQKRMRWINWWGRTTSLLYKINWILYGFDRVIKYRNFQVFAPLPFDSCFYNAGKYYPSDLIVAHDLPSLKAASRLSESWKVPLVYDAHELYYEQAVFSGVQKKMMHGREQELISKCAAVFTVNQSIAEEMGRRYRCKTPHVLCNAVDPPPGFNPEKKTNKLHEHFNIDSSVPVILYQGGLSPLRNLETSRHR